MRETREVRKFVRMLEDVICDMCGESCTINKEYSPAFATLSMHGHYCTSYDLTHLKADLCENCFRYIMEVIKSKGGKIRKCDYYFSGGCELCEEEQIPEFDHDPPDNPINTYNTCPKAGVEVKPEDKDNTSNYYEDICGEY